MIVAAALAFQVVMSKASAPPYGIMQIDSGSGMVGGGNMILNVSNVGRVTCYRVRESQLQYGARGMYFALCGHHRKLAMPTARLHKPQ